MKIPFYNLANVHHPLKVSFLETVSEIIDRNDFILGKETEQFENNFARLCGVKHAIGVGNGLDALKISLQSLNIARGDEVIVPAHTYIATWLAVSEIGAIPVPVDACEDSMNINVELIEAKITAKTKAIISVHIYGQICDMERIISLAKRYNLYVVEDFAQAQGATYNGKKAGAFGHINGTSFYPGKNLGALGDAGAITTDDDELAEKARTIRNYGSLVKYHHETVGVNSRLDTIQAALLDIKLKYLEEWNNERVRLTGLYRGKLKDTEAVKIQQHYSSIHSVHHLFVMLTERRDELQKYLSDNGVGTIIHYPIPPHLQNAYQYLKLKKGSFPVAEKIAETCLSLPLYVGLNDDEVEYVCVKIKEFLSD